MIAKLTETVSIELRPGLSGTGVDSIVATKFGGAARNQMFWSSDHSTAQAFFNGMLAARAIFKGANK